MTLCLLHVVKDGPTVGGDPTHKGVIFFFLSSSMKEPYSYNSIFPQEYTALPALLLPSPPPPPP